MRTGLPVLDLAFHITLLFLHLDLLIVDLLDSLLKVVNDLVFQRVPLVLLVQLSNQISELLLLLLHIDRVAFQIIVFLLFENAVKFQVEAVDDVVQLDARVFNFIVVFVRLLSVELIVVISLESAIERRAGVLSGRGLLLAG